MNQTDRNRLMELVEGLAGMTDVKERKRLAEGLPAEVSKAGGTPLFDKNGRAVLLWEGEADKVGILGDMNDWIEPDPLVRIPDTRLWVWRGVFEADARLEYLVCAEPGNTAPDPLNPWHSLNGLWTTSELAMPDYQRAGIFLPLADGCRGSTEGLQELLIPSAILGYPHTVHCQSFGRNPALSIWFQDGLDYIACAHAPLILRTLAEQNQLPSFRAFYVTPPNLHQPLVPNRSTEYGLNADYIHAFCDEFVPSAESAGGNPPALQRIVVGDSYGGLISLAIGLRRPDCFQAAYGQSSYCSFSGDSLIREAAGLGHIEIKLALDCGTWERKVGASFIPPAEMDFISANRRMKEALKATGIPHHYAERHEGHTWGNWRKGLLWALPLLARDLGQGLI
jgi:enterochelin esterase family protein